MILNDKYYIDDIETGEWFEVSKETHDAQIERIKSISTAAIKAGYKPIIYLAGTTENNSDNSFEKLWKNEKEQPNNKP